MFTKIRQKCYSKPWLIWIFSKTG